MSLLTKWGQPHASAWGYFGGGTKPQAYARGYRMGLGK
jgi:hypothetical protein